MHQWKILKDSVHGSGKQPAEAISTEQLDVVDDASTLLPVKSTPRAPNGRRQPTQFAVQVYQISKLWKELPMKERQIWEQRATVAVNEYDDDDEAPNAHSR